MSVVGPIPIEKEGEEKEGEEDEDPVDDEYKECEKLEARSRDELKQYDRNWVAEVNGLRDAESADEYYDGRYSGFRMDPDHEFFKATEFRLRMETFARRR